MTENNRDDFVGFYGGIGGTKISKREAKKVSLGITFGIVGIVISLLTIGFENKFVSLIIIFTFALFGYFVLGERLFKK